MIDEIWSGVGKNNAHGLQIYGDKDKYLVKHKIQGQPNMTMAEYIEFHNEKISKMEVYMGSEPLK